MSTRPDVPFATVEQLASNYNQLLDLHKSQQARQWVRRMAKELKHG